MKRTLASLLAISLLSLLFAPVVFAEEPFSFRDGILFGDSLDSVRSKDARVIEQEVDSTGWLSAQSGEVDGISDAVVEYHFDSNSCLDMALIRYGGEGIQYHDAMAAWKSVTSILKERHGAPSCIFYSSRDLHTTPALEEANKRFASAEKAGYSANMSMYNEWIIRGEGISLKIEHVLYCLKLKSTGEKTYAHLLGYKLLTDAELNTKPEAPAATPVPRRAIVIPIKITDVSITKNSIGIPELSLRLTNGGSDYIDRVDFLVRCYDAYGDRIKGYDYYDRTQCYYDDILEPQKSSGIRYWTLYGFEGTRKVEIAIVKYHVITGGTVEIPENELVWRPFR